jgi:hypothetical protein
MVTRLIRQGMWLRRGDDSGPGGIFKKVGCHIWPAPQTARMESHLREEQGRVVLGNHLSNADVRAVMKDNSFHG